MTHDELSDRMKKQIDGLPREILPERNLWPGIQKAITDSKVVHARFEARSEATARTSFGWRRFGLVAAAAMLLIVASSGITAYLLRSPAANPAGTIDGRADFEIVAWEGFVAAEQEYQRVTDELLGALEAQRDELAPETVEVVERNLALIDQAIGEARAALERDPANTKLVHKLTDMYRTRVTFLEQMSQL
jgi:hypothetical protein